MKLRQAISLCTAVTMCIFLEITAACGVTWGDDFASNSADVIATSNTTWPQFRGRNASGVAAEDKTLPAHFGLNKNVLWKARIPSGVSAPCVWDDRIFLTCFDRRSNKLETICVDGRDGRILWRRDAPINELEKTHNVSSPANATPASDGRRVFVYFASYGVLCYDIDGRELWSKPLPVGRLSYGNGASPVVFGNRLILNLDEGAKWVQNTEGEWQPGKPNSRVMALDCVDGSTLWEMARQENGARYATPAVWSRPDSKQVALILAGQGQITGYDIATGEKLWWANFEPRGVKATPVVDGDRVFITATGTHGEPETFLGIPTFEDFLTQHDKDGDGLVGREEIPEDLLVVDRRASNGVGNSPLKMFMFAHTMDPDRDGRITQAEWNKERDRLTKVLPAPPGLYCVRLGGRGDVTQTHIEWRQSRGVSEVPTPLVYRGRLYVVRNGGIVHCRNVQTGREYFRGRIGAIGGYYASPVAGNGKIYFASDRGVISVLEASDKLKVLARNELGERIMATPALVDGTVYVRTDSQLLAFATSGN